MLKQQKSLLRAAKSGNLKRIELLLNEGVEVNCFVEDSETRDEITPLHAAALRGQLNAIDLLLSKGASLNEKSKIHQRTAFLFSILKSQRYTARKFIKANADLGALDRYGNTAFHYAVYCNDIEIIDDFFDRKLNAEIKNDDGETPLHTAAFEGKILSVEKLIAHGVSLNEQDFIGRTPLMRATYYLENIKTVELLLAHGSSVELAEFRGYTPLHGAALKGNCEAVKGLLDYGADVRVVSDFGLTPLHSAALGNNSATFYTLLNKGADIEACTDYKRTPLHFAASVNAFNSIQALVQYGANRAAIDYAGSWPLDLFYPNCSEDDDDIMKLLEPDLPFVDKLLSMFFR
ncbi:MAG: ankyrin repeat domain-containing protein [Alphaproteobacteria bacterium]|nr:ankyrin repeat domain-containing protein [Alphaproteobacteria bacterium]MBL6777212.1 ankyrin repeat domain-containing protein [Alphaproteobacteria bacterium]